MTQNGARGPAQIDLSVDDIAALLRLVDLRLPTYLTAGYSPSEEVIDSATRSLVARGVIQHSDGETAVPTAVLSMVESLAISPIRIRVRRTSRVRSSVVWFMAGPDSSTRTQIVETGQWRLFSFPTDQVPAFLSVECSLEPGRREVTDTPSGILPLESHDSFMGLVFEGDAHGAAEVLSAHGFDGDLAESFASSLSDSGERVEIMVVSPDDQGDRAFRAAVVSWLHAPGFGLARVERVDGLRPEEPPTEDTRFGIAAATDEEILAAILTALAQAGRAGP